METRERILALRIMNKIRKHPGYCEYVDAKVKSAGKNEDNKDEYFIKAPG